MAIVIATGCSTDSGTLFTLHGRGEAKSFEVILAEPNVAMQVRQRDGQVPFMPSPAPAPETEVIDYYRQHDTTKRIAGGVIEGFQIRVEPVEDEANYIPFVLAFDAEEGGNVVAIGHFGSVPAKIALPRDRVTRSDIDLESVTRTTDGKLGSGTVFQGACPGATTATGYAWRRATGPEIGAQLRLMVTPELDLDCDGVAVAADPRIECDDLSPEFNEGVLEACPTTFDYDCDNQASEVMPCSFGGISGNACVGEQQCGEPNATCSPFNGDQIVCACAQDLCSGCTLRGQATMALGELAACAPSSSKLQNVCVFDGGCTVTVQAPVGWLAGVTSNPSGTAPTTTTTMGRNSDLYLAVGANGGTLTTGAPGTEFGDIRLEVAPLTAMSPADRPYFRFYRLRLQTSMVPVPECPMGTLPSTSDMDCRGLFAPP